MIKRDMKRLETDRLINHEEKMLTLNPLCIIKPSIPRHPVVGKKPEKIISLTLCVYVESRKQASAASY